MTDLSYAVSIAMRRLVSPDHGSCFICGCHPSLHLVRDSACPETADSLTTALIEAWHRSGGSFADAMEASSDLRQRALDVGLYYPAVTAEQEREARQRIADDLNGKGAAK